MSTRDDQSIPAAGLRERVRDLMPRAQEELARLVEIPSVAFPDFPRQPVDAAARTVADLMKESGLPGVDRGGLDRDLDHHQ